MPGRTRTSRSRRLRRASRSSGSTIRSWWTPNAGIIAGHGRLLAARKLGLEQVPVVVLDHLSETQKRAYIIADNRISENAGWDEEMLAAELGELQAADLTLDLLGFSDDELADAPGRGRACGGGCPPRRRGDPEAPAEPVTRPGDVWVIGQHRLICGDCRDYGTWSATRSTARGERGDHVAAVRHAARVRSHERLQARAARRVRARGSGMWPPISRQCLRTTAPTF